jgi:hypothetical protein
VERWEKMDEAKRKGRFPLGVLVDRDLPLFSDHYRRVCEEAALLRRGKAGAKSGQEGCS